MNNNDYAIDIKCLSKTYKRKIQALQEVSLQVKKGQIFGLLGSNGAGKSTLMKILMTVVRPTYCEGTMLGKTIGHKATLGRIGYLPEHLMFPDYLTGEQVLDYCGGMLKVPGKIRAERINKLLPLVGMAEARKRRMKTYSKGMKQRIGIAQALINDPELVFLDEPAEGVDPKGRKEIREMILKMKNEGGTVFINSHLLSEIELVSDSVAILNKGVIIKNGPLKELTGDNSYYEIKLTGDCSLGKKLLELLIKNKAGIYRETGGCSLKMPTVDTARLQPIIDSLRAANKQIVWIKPVHRSLEDLFMETVGKVSEDDMFEPVTTKIPEARENKP